MVSKRSNRGAAKTSKSQSRKSKRSVQIQGVFDQLGIGDDESRERFLRLQQLGESRKLPEYRVVLTGSTAV